MQALKAAFCQLLAGLLTIQLSSFRGDGAFPVEVWVLQPLLAALFSFSLRQPIWWLPIHLLFLPMVYLWASWSLSAWIYLLVFVLLLSVYWGVIRGDAPLFLSPLSVANALIGLIEQEAAESFIDLGAGVGSVVLPIAKRFPGLKIKAVERAPIPYLILSWRCRRLSNVTVVRRDFWDCRLARYDMVYAFLSPGVMRRLGEKCRREIDGGKSLLVSSSFPLPSENAGSVVDAADGALKLYCYRFGRD